MIKDLILAPIIIAIILGTFFQLVQLADAAGQKTVDYSENMVKAVDCALEARPLQNCMDQSTNQTNETIPNLSTVPLNPDVSGELQMLMEINQDLMKQNIELLENLNQNSN